MTANRRDEADLQIDENGDLVVVPGVESLLNSISERFARMADEARLEFNRAYFASRPEPPGLARNRRARERWVGMTREQRESWRRQRQWVREGMIITREPPDPLPAMARYGLDGI
jgi:hypothetical protein